MKTDVPKHVVGATVRIYDTNRLGIIHGCIESDVTVSVNVEGSISLYYKKDVHVVTKQSHPELFI